MRLFPPLTTSDEELGLFRDALLSVVASASTLRD
jgi:hypothetical protein